MSIFGTLRKKGKKLSVDQEQSFSIGLKVDKSETPLFNSTPNLHKITNESDSRTDNDQHTSEDGDPPGNISEQLCYDHERNQYYKKSANKYQYLDRKKSIPSCESLGSNISCSSANSKPKSSSPSTSLKTFVSFVSMASGLKRSKSIRKQAFASAIVSTYKLNVKYLISSAQNTKPFYTY